MEARRLEARIATLRGQVGRVLTLYGTRGVVGVIVSLIALAWLGGCRCVVGVIVPLIVLAGLAYWLIHLDSVVRLLILVGLIGVGGWLVYRYVVLPLIVRFGDLDIALRIEERWPGLNDRLTSTVQFVQLDAGDDRYGSAALREATVRQAIAETSTIDFREVIEPRPVLQALGLAATALVLGAVVV